MRSPLLRAPVRRSLRTGIAALALAIALPGAAQAQAGTITFQNTGDGGAVVPIFTGPTLTTGGTVRTGFGNAPSANANLAYWSSQYSGGPAVYGGANGIGTVAEFTLGHTAGETLALTGGLFGTYPNAGDFIRIRIFDLDFNQLFDQVIDTDAATQTLVSFGGVSTQSGLLRLQFTETDAQGAFAGRGAFDTGFSQLTYRATNTTVPEPQTWLLLASGLGVIGGIARRRRTTA
jgi:hypothetical protein